MTRWPAARLAEVAVVAAAYAGFTILLAPLSYGQLQLRLAECLKPLVLWEPHLIPAFVLGNFLANLQSPFVGPWELGWMPAANLVGGWLGWRLGQINVYLGAATYGTVIAAAVATMLSVLLHVPIVALFPALWLSEVTLLVLGVPVMRPVHAALMRVLGTRGGAAS